MSEYIKIPKGLDRAMLERTFGYDAVSFYLKRIEQRRQEGKTYLNPLKTVYIWATEDKKRTGAFTHRIVDIPGVKSTKITEVRKNDR